MLKRIVYLSLGITISIAAAMLMDYLPDIVTSKYGFTLILAKTILFFTILSSLIAGVAYFINAKIEW